MTLYDSLCLMQDNAKPPDSSMLIFMLLAIAFAFYFMIMRPQKRDRQEREKQLSALKKGDRIVTVGGIHGKIVDVDEKIITVDVGKNTRIDFSRNAVASLDKKEGESASAPREEPQK